MAGKIKVATATLCGCFGCHMSLLDIDERLFELVKIVEFDRTPLTDIKTTDMLVGARQLTPTAEKIRRLMHYGQTLQSHALHFFHL